MGLLIINIYAMETTPDALKVLKFLNTSDDVWEDVERILSHCKIPVDRKQAILANLNGMVEKQDFLGGETIIAISDEGRNLVNSQPPPTVEEIISMVNAQALTYIKSFHKDYEPIIEHTLLTRFGIGSPIEPRKQAVQLLIDSGLVSRSGDSLLLTEMGIRFKKEYDLFEDEEICNTGNVEFPVLKFLHLLNDKIGVDYFPKIIIDSVPDAVSGSGELNLIHYLSYSQPMKNYIDSTANNLFGLSEAGKRAYQVQLKNQSRSKQQAEKPLVHIENFNHSPNTTTFNGDVNAPVAVGTGGDVD